MSDPGKRTSKFLSLLLRHRPEVIGLTLDENGWARVDDLLEKLNAHGHALTFEQLKTVVADNDKQRFIFSEDLALIRANQGHSLDVDLQLKEMTPPAILYHGTAEKNLGSIREKGLVRGTRHHVHLSADHDTAVKVGMRYGRPVVLSIDASSMSKNGYKFFCSENGVWLTEFVLPEYIRFEPMNT